MSFVCAVNEALTAYGFSTVETIVEKKFVFVVRAGHVYLKNKFSFVMGSFDVE